MTSSRAITSGLTLALEIGRPLAITGCVGCAIAGCATYPSRRTGAYRINVLGSGKPILV